MRKSALRLVELVAAHPQVSQNAVNLWGPVQLQKPFEVLKIVRNKGKARVLEGVGRRVGILIEGDKPTLAS
jgi:hypothetical protein